MRNFIYAMIIFTVFLYSQYPSPKKELIVYDDDFSALNWQVYSNIPGDSINHFGLSNLKYRSANSALAIFASYPGAQDEWIISPALDFSGATSTPLLTFYEDHDFWYQSKGKHEILYALKENPSADDFTSLVSWQKEEHSIYGFYGQPINIELDGMAGEPIVHLAFRYTSDSDQYDDNWYIDDLKISQNVLYDATLIFSSLVDDSKLSSSLPNTLVIRPQNRGLEKVSFPVIAKLFDFNGKLTWSDSLQTDELDYLGTDTLTYSIDVVTDSAWFNLIVYTRLSGDQAKKNDTLSYQLNTFRYPRTTVAEAFLSSTNYYSEGPALVLDSLARASGEQIMLPFLHYYFETDTLYSPSGANIAISQGINNASTVLLNRNTRFYIPATSFQDWTRQIAGINTGILAENNLKSSASIDGQILSNDGEGHLQLSVRVIQRASLPDKPFSLQVWWLEKSRAFDWLRLDSLKHRALAQIYSDQFNSAFKGDEIYSGTFDFNLPTDSSLQTVPLGQSQFVGLVLDQEGRIENAAVFSAKPQITSVDPENQNLFPSAFTITGNYPNPFNPTTRLEFSLPGSGKVEIEIYSVIGQLITHEAHIFQKGLNSWIWDARGNASGAYFAVIKYAGFQTVHKMILMK